MLLGAFKKALDLVLSSFIDQVSDLLDVIDLGNEESRKAGAEVLLPIVREYRQKSADIAAQMMQEEAEKLGADAHIPTLLIYRKEWLVKEMKRVASAKELQASLRRHVAAGARSLVQSAVPEPMAGNKELAVSLDEAEPYDVQEMPGKPVAKRGVGKSERRKTVYPIAYARVLTGSTSCAFCVMLASRGPVYSSASKAGAKGKGAVFTPWAPNDRWANSYHDHCDCLVVPVFSDKQDWIGKDAVEPLYELYREVAKGTMNKSASGGENESLQAWKAYLEELSEKGEQLPVPELDSAQYQASVASAQADSFLDGISESIQDTLIPTFDIKTLIGSKFRERSWGGEKGKGGHSPLSVIPGKSRVPAGWSYEEFEQAAIETVAAPDFFIDLKQGPAFIKKITDKAGNNIWFRAQVNAKTHEIFHFYPIAGDNVTELDKNLEVVGSTFRPGTLKGAKNVIR